MVVRNVVRSPVRAVVQSVFGEGESFHPFQLFRSGAQGAWYDPSDFSTLYQDAAGTTPVTAVEQPVRLMLDRSRGLVLGSPLALGTWTQIVGAGTITGSGADVVFAAALDNNYATPAAVLVTGAGYEITVNVLAISAGSVRPRIGGGQTLGLQNSTGSVTYVVSATATDFRLVAVGTTTTATVSVSIRELPGNHAVAPNDASRPILRARYNLLTRTEEFDDAVWNKTGLQAFGSGSTANAGVAPDGTTTADLITETATNARHMTFRTIATVSGAVYTASLYVKASGRTAVTVALKNVTGSSPRYSATFNLSTGAVATSDSFGSPTNTASSVVALGDGWYRCNVQMAAAGANTNIEIGISDSLTPVYSESIPTYLGDGNSGILIWGAQLLTAADHAATGGAYQRVGAATDYDTGPPWRPYLAFDGSDDSMSTSSIDFSGTDKMTVFAGVSKLSDAATGTIIELSTTVGPTNNGSFAIFAPENTIEFKSYMRGTANGGRDIDSAAFAAPVTAVMYSTADIGANVRQFVVNGVSGTGAESMGTGNFGNYPLFIGRRNNASLPFNGRLYGLTVLGRTATVPELTAMESWIAGKTGVSL